MNVNEIYNDNCMNLLHYFEDDSVDMVLMDPPYKKTAEAWDQPLDLWLLWKHLDRIVKKNGAVLIFTNQPYTSEVVLSNKKYFKDEYIWVKTKCSNFMNAKKQPMRNHENILVFYRKPPTYNPQGLVNVHIKSGRNRNKGGRVYGRTGVDNKPEYIQTHSNYPKTVLQFNSEHNPLHPTQKPLALCEYLVKTYSKEFDIVLDPCCGLGTVPLACKNNNRYFIGIELEEEFAELANRRLK